MSVSRQARSSLLRGKFSKPLAALIFIWLLLGVQRAPAQTFSVLYNFTGGPDGGRPWAGVTVDGAGNLYGIATEGGNPHCSFGGDIGCGTVFKLTHKSGGWTFGLLYSFAGGTDGWWPYAPVTHRPDGTLYGTTYFGGGTGCAGYGCGTVFQLRPPPTVCRSVMCPWTETEIYKFTGSSDGSAPIASLTFDPNGNIYGTSSEANQHQNYGTVYELSPSSGGWVPTVLHTFTDYFEAGEPYAGVIFDQQGNLWGSTELGGTVNCGGPQFFEPCGTLFKLTPSGSGWNYRSAYQFQRSVGGYPNGTFIIDQSGNLYGTLAFNGPQGNGGVYQFNTSTGVLTLLYGVSGDPNEGNGPQGGVVVDPAGNLYGVDPYDGPYFAGFVFKLSPSSGGWTFTDLHDFTGGSDGATPFCTLALDANGNVYGTTNLGGSHNKGTVFKIAP